VWIEVGRMRIDIEQEQDGRWIAEVPDLPGVLAYGQTRIAAISKAQALALRVIADRLDNGESIPDLDGAEGSHLHSSCLATPRQDVKSTPCDVPE
jgi:predicted RNase H-like HicB family nuclease